MDVAVGRGYRMYPSPNMSKNKAQLCLQRKVWHTLRKVRHRLRKGIETLNVRCGIANFFIIKQFYFFHTIDLIKNID